MLWLAGRQEPAGAGRPASFARGHWRSAEHAPRTRHRPPSPRDTARAMSQENVEILKRGHRRLQPWRRVRCRFPFRPRMWNGGLRVPFRVSRAPTGGRRRLGSGWTSFGRRLRKEFEVSLGGVRPHREATCLLVTELLRGRGRSSGAGGGDAHLCRVPLRRGKDSESGRLSPNGTPPSKPQDFRSRRCRRRTWSWPISRVTPSTGATSTPSWRLPTPALRPHSRIVELEGGGPYRGHDGVRRRWNDVFAIVPDLSHEIEEVRDVGDVTVVRVRQRGRGAGERRTHGPDAVVCHQVARQAGRRWRVLI